MQLLSFRQEIGEQIFRENIEYVKSQHRDIAISYGKFEEVIDVFIRLIDNDDDVVEALQFLLDLCRIDVLNETMTNITNQSRTNLSEEQRNNNALPVNAMPNDDNSEANSITLEEERSTSTLEKLL